MIHVIGDSHVCFFNGADGITDLYPYAHSNPPFLTYRIGAALAYNVCKAYSTCGTKEAIEAIASKISASDSILLSFGEIDCRYHIKHQSVKQNTRVQNIINDCVERYITAIQPMCHKHKIGVWGPVATTHWPVENSSHECMVEGSHEERNEITRLFNEQLKIRSTETGVKFFSVFEQLLCPDGTTNQYYYADYIHLGKVATSLMLQTGLVEAMS
jgi:hypothetical protein